MAQKPPVPMGDNVFLLIALVCGIIVIVCLAILFPPSSGHDDGVNDSPRPTPTPTPQIERYAPVGATGSNAEFSTTVTDVAILTCDNYQVSFVRPTFAPDAGNEYIMLKIEQTNLQSDTLTYPDLYWRLYTSDGLVHRPTGVMTNDDSPDGIQAGATVTYHVVFEISKSAEPVSLVWDTWPSYLSFSIDLDR